MKKLNLLTKIMIGFALGVIVGLIFGTGAEIVKPLGDLFLRLIKFIIVPLVLSSLVVGTASTGDIRKLGRMGGKTIIYYLLTTVLAITIGLVIGNVMSPGEGLNIVSSGAPVDAKDAPSLISTILNIIPTNPFDAITSGNMLQIIFFAIMLGIGITFVGEKGLGVLNFFDSLAEVMYKITSIVMAFAPIGVFGLIAPVVGKYGTDVLLPLINLIIAAIIASLIHLIFTYSSVVKVFGKMSPIKFFKGILPAFAVAFSTSSSAGTLPVTMRNAEENLGVSKKVSSFVLPLGATINMDGTAIYQGVSALFIAQFFGIELGLTQQITIVLTATLASIGTAGVPGAGMIMLTLVLKSVGLPLEGIALIAGVDRILDMIRTSLNVVGDASAAVFVAATENEIEQPKETNTTISA